MRLEGLHGGNPFYLNLTPGLCIVLALIPIQGNALSWLPADGSHNTPVKKKLPDFVIETDCKVEDTTTTFLR